MITQIDNPVSTTRYAAHDLLGCIDQDRGRFADALQHYRLAFFAEFYDYILIPEEYDNFYQLACNSAYCESRLAIENNEQAHAVEAATTLTTMDPEHLDLLIPLINAFKSHGWSDDAESLIIKIHTPLEQTLLRFPSSHYHHYLLARLDVDTGFPTTQSANHLKRALQLAPANPDYLSLSARDKSPASTLKAP